MTEDPYRHAPIRPPPMPSSPWQLPKVVRVLVLVVLLVVAQFLFFNSKNPALECMAIGFSVTGFALAWRWAVRHDRGK